MQRKRAIDSLNELIAEFSKNSGRRPKFAWLCTSQHKAVITYLKRVDLLDKSDNSFIGTKLILAKEMPPGRMIVSDNEPKVKGHRINAGHRIEGIWFDEARYLKDKVGRINWPGHNYSTNMQINLPAWGSGSSKRFELWEEQIKQYLANQ